jgi:hypothetical protein
MDKDPQELGGLGAWGVAREAGKVVGTNARLYAGLTLTLIVPLCAVGLGRGLVLEPMVGRIEWDEYVARHMRAGTAGEERANDDMRRRLLELDLALAAYTVLILGFSLLSTSAVVYSVACVYSSRSAGYRLVLAVVPRVWLRLLATFAWALPLMLGYTILFFAGFVVLAFVAALVTGGSQVAMGAIVPWAGVALFMAGFVYLSCIWHVACVVTVLENAYGLAALRIATRLVRGPKALVAAALLSAYLVLAFLIDLAFGLGVVFHANADRPDQQQILLTSTIARFALALLLIALLSLLDLLGFVVQTVFYFSCKAHWREPLDRVELSEHLGAYLGEYVPLRSSIQLEPLQP